MWRSKSVSASAASTPPGSPPGRPGRRARGGGSTPDSTAPKPTVAHMRRRHAWTAASAGIPSFRMASTRGRDAST